MRLDLTRANDPASIRDHQKASPIQATWIDPCSTNDRRDRRLIVFSSRANDHMSSSSEIVHHPIGAVDLGVTIVAELHSARANTLATGRKPGHIGLTALHELD